MNSFEAGKITELSNNKINELIKLLKENGLTEKSEALQTAICKLSDEERIKVAFVGQYSAGKSSIISAMTGNKEIKIGSDVTTQNIDYFQWGNFLLADTPGLHDNDTHDEIANEAIKKSDLIVYCITSELFNKNTLADYIDIVYNKGYASKIILVINKLNSEATTDRAQLIENYKESINDALAPHSINDVKYAFFDVLDYLKGVASNNERRKEHSNFGTFLELLNAFLDEKGLLFKLTTPLYQAKNVIDEAFIDGSENDVDLARRTTLTRLEKLVYDLRDRATREWDSIVIDKYISFIRTANTYVNSIGEDGFDFNFEIEKLSNDTENELLDELKQFIENCIDTLNFESESVFESAQAQFYIKNAPKVEIENSAIFKTVKSPADSTDKKNYGEIKDGIVGVIPVLKDGSGADIVRGGRDLIQKITKKLGKEVKIKFKPHGIKKAGKALEAICKYAGPALDAVGVVLEFWDAFKDHKEAKEYEKAIREIHNSLSDYKKSAEKVWKDEKNDFIKDVYNALIAEIQKEKQSILDGKEKAQEFNDSLSALMNDIEALIQSIFLSEKELLNK